MLRQRLMRDVAELQLRPCPNISLSLKDEDTTKACLILTPNSSAPLHLTIEIGDRYSPSAPRVTIQSKIVHPNIYICASMPNTDEGYTQAYTLKGIAIQLMSFFGIETIEQVGTGANVELTRYRNSFTGDFGCSKGC
jgi:ubiquitin-protein ligase